ncbi:MAG: hypothetical protein IT463_06350, partial [Planctomycetes bacterium]|nr:hypothetical protein [Planctomycetota bacterium]
VLDRFVADEPLKLHPAEADARHAARLLAALRSQPDPDIAAQAAAFPAAGFRDAVLEAQLAVLREDRAAARKLSARADSLLQQLPAGITPDLEYHALHFRNCLRANAGKDLQSRATEFFRRLARDGCLEAAQLLKPGTRQA